jgi:hypothetical protein
VVEADVLLCQNWSGKLRKDNGLALGFPQGSHNGLCERYLSLSPQCHKPALTIAYFPMRRYVRANNPASGEKPFGNGQPKPLGQRRSYDRFTPGVAPLQVWLGQSFKKAHAFAKAQG